MSDVESSDRSTAQKDVDVMFGYANKKIKSGEQVAPKETLMEDLKMLNPMVTTLEINRKQDYARLDYRMSPEIRSTDVDKKK